MEGTESALDRSKEKSCQFSKYIFNVGWCNKLKYKAELYCPQSLPHQTSLSAEGNTLKLGVGKECYKTKTKTIKPLHAHGLLFEEAGGKQENRQKTVSTQASQSVGQLPPSRGWRQWGLAVRDLPKHGSEMVEQENFLVNQKMGSQPVKQGGITQSSGRKWPGCGKQADLQNLTTAQILSPHLSSAEWCKMV